jgi:hypothetical protein
MRKRFRGNYMIADGGGLSSEEVEGGNAGTGRQLYAGKPAFVTPKVGQQGEPNEGL